MSDTWPSGVGRRVLPEVDSTNAEAARCAASLAGPEWILALRQTKGRGRRGRPWADPEGNFAATLVMHPHEAPDQIALRSFVAALALFDAFAEVTGHTAPFSLKWPNDVLLNGGKVAGILLEAGGPQSARYLAIGIGVNLSAVPEAPEGATTQPVALAEETGTLTTPEEFLDALAPAFAKWEAQFTTYGFAPIRRAWLSHAAKLGEVITARTMRDEMTGTFEGIDEAGNLILKTAQGTVAVTAADVYF